MLLSVANRKSIHQNVDDRSIRATQSLLVISHRSVLQHQAGEFVEVLDGRKYLRTHLSLQKILTTAIAQHLNQSVVDFHEAAGGSGKKYALLNVVEQFAIATLGFLAIGDVFEHMNCLPTVSFCSVHTSGGDKIGSI